MTDVVSPSNISQPQLPSSSSSSAPSSHSYLGDAQQRSFVIKDLIPGKEYELLLYPLPDVVLFPGETLPLRLQSRDFIRKLQQQINAVIEGNEEVASHIGVVHVYRRGYTGAICNFGTTIELQYTHNNTTLDDEELILTSKGKYRFKILQIRNTSIVPIAKVVILQDQIPTRPVLQSVQNPFAPWIYNLASVRRLTRIAYQLYESTLVWQGKESNPLVNAWGPFDKLGSEALRSKAEMWACATLHQRPFCIKAELDPVAFSFFLSANMPVSSLDLQKLIQAEDVIERLQLAIKLLEEGSNKMLGCSVCGQILAKKSDLFNLPGAEGIAGAYVNAHGAVHQTMTISRLSDQCDVRFQGQACTQDSWFPGYAWTIAYCGVCRNHLGWKFTVARASDAHSFDDLAHDDEDEDDDSDDVYEDISGDDSSTAMASSQQDGGSDEETAMEGAVQESTSDRGTEDMTQDDEEDDDGTASHSSYFSTQDQATASIVSDESYQSLPPPSTLPITETTVDQHSSTEAVTSTLTNVSETQVLEFWGLRRSALREF